MDFVIDGLNGVSFAHPQGCRGYLLADSESREALAVDVHLDLVHEVVERAKKDGLTVTGVIDTHTHADHPSGSGAFAAAVGCKRIAHAKGGHVGVTHHPEDGEAIALGARTVTVRHAPGHTPDHLLLITDGALFTGDTLLIGGVARTDFLGGDAGLLHDTIHNLLLKLPEETVVFPGHDYQNRDRSTIGDEKRDNPWLQISDRAEFVEKLTANPPPKPANMDDLLRLNREGVDIADTLSAAEAEQRVAAGGAASVIDVRTGAEFSGEHVPGTRLIPLDQLEKRLDDVRAVPAPRLLLCRTGNRATMARKTLEKLHVGGLTVIEGGIVGYGKTGGETVKGKAVMSLERQVRIGAGGMVLGGLILGSLVNKKWRYLSGFVGCGLIFAGVTDWCGMGILLSKMPWNQADADGEGRPTGSCAAGPPPACAATPPPSCEAAPPSA